jgi:hypothetical protein
MGFKKGDRTQHRYTLDDIGKLETMFDTQLLTAAALIYANEEPVDDKDERLELMDRIAEDVLSLRDALIDAITIETTVN